MSVCRVAPTVPRQERSSDGSSIIPGRQTAFLTFFQRNPSHRAGSQLCAAPPVAPEFTPELCDPVGGVGALRLPRLCLDQ